jgi:hypothetical protein
MLTTDEGRARFWAESAVENDGKIQFVFPNRQKLDVRVLQKSPDELLVIE